jgi:hypothetical protein
VIETLGVSERNRSESAKILWRYLLGLWGWRARVGFGESFAWNYGSG